jgi:AcrR family transcriptional regulator
VRAPRSDAEHNRARILEVARAALTASGDVALSSIAKQAGVGQGTMYRHFPNREALLLAVYRQDVEALVDAVPALLETYPPFEALQLWFARLASYGRVKYGLADAFEAATRAGLSSEYYGRVTGAIALLLGACQRTGEVRPDVDADEVLLLVSFLWRMHNDDAQQRARHLLTLVLDGLRPPPHGLRSPPDDVEPAADHRKGEHP